MFTIGVVGRCLSKALVQAQALTPKCRELVLVAAPKDSRVYLQYPESASALVQKIAELQRAAGELGLEHAAAGHTDPAGIPAGVW
jgi:Golgi apparatus protein 1